MNDSHSLQYQLTIHRRSSDDAVVSSSSVNGGGGGMRHVKQLLFWTQHCQIVHTNSYSDYTTNNDDDDNNEPEEYVTDLYRQKRLEKRELAAKTVARSNGGDHHLRSAADHSLDHYFDHHDAIVNCQEEWSS
jgi:hypothetical protein